MKTRFSAFIVVGAIGFLVQIGAIALMTMVAGWRYGPATAIAVELAVVHNFLWHERWTWRDRIEGGDGVTSRFLKFQVSNGLTSLAGNLLLMTVFVEFLRLNPVMANVVSVVLISAVNFLWADRWVFTRRATAIAAAMFAVAPSPVSAAELRVETTAAWNQYVAGTEAQWRHQRPGPQSEEPQGQAIAVPGGTIHDWRSSTVIHGITVDALVRALMYPGTPPPQEDVLESRLLSRSGETLLVYLKITRRTLMTVTYDTEHQVTFERPNAGYALSRSASTHISEVDGRDRGFLWRLNSYWRYEQVGDDVRIDMRSLSLSRNVPALLRPVANPIVNRIARESMVKTLDAVRNYVEQN